MGGTRMLRGPGWRLGTSFGPARSIATKQLRPVASVACWTCSAMLLLPPDRRANSSIPCEDAPRSTNSRTNAGSVAAEGITVDMMRVTRSTGSGPSQPVLGAAAVRSRVDAHAGSKWAVAATVAEHGRDCRPHREQRGLDMWLAATQRRKPVGRSSACRSRRSYCSNCPGVQHVSAHSIDARLPRRRATGTRWGLGAAPGVRSCPPRRAVGSTAGSNVDSAYSAQGAPMFSMAPTSPTSRKRASSLSVAAIGAVVADVLRGRCARRGSGRTPSSATHRSRRSSRSSSSTSSADASATTAPIAPPATDSDDALLRDVRGCRRHRKYRSPLCRVRRSTLIPRAGS